MNETKKDDETSDVAFYIGMQSGYGNMPSFELWNLLIDIPGHPKGSTLRRQTIEKAGYILPEAPKI